MRCGLIFIFVIAFGVAVTSAQQTKNEGGVPAKMQDKTLILMDSIADDHASSQVTAQEEINSIYSDLRKDVTDVKSEIKRTKEQTAKADDKMVSDVKKLSKTDGEKLIERNTDKLQYDSENPDAAPWKQNPFSPKDKGNKLPDSFDQNISVDKKAEEYSEKLKNISVVDVKDKNPVLDDRIRANNLNLKGFDSISDSLLQIKREVDFANIEQQLAGSKRVYSDKFVKRLYDSLGSEKGDSIFKIAAPLLKSETSKEELLKKLNSAMVGNNNNGVDLDPNTGSLKISDSEKLTGIPDQVKNTDLSRFKLPDSLLQELEPLKGRTMSSKYLPMVDSMRDVVLKAKGMTLEKKQITDHLAKTAVKRKPKFVDKMYFEGIVGFVNDSTFNILQLSPSLGYHITYYLSAGLGPNFLLQFQDKRVNMMAGFRSFVKAEIWKQRAYLQVEDNVGQARWENESIQMKNHALLAGGGGLLPLSKKLAVNFSLLYQLNKDTTSPNRSPWVIRVGVSSMKQINSDH